MFIIDASLFLSLEFISIFFLYSNDLVVSNVYGANTLVEQFKLERCLL